MRETILIFMLLIIAPLVAVAQSSMMSTSNTTSTTTNNNSSTTTTSTTSSTNGNILTTVTPPMLTSEQIQARDRRDARRSGAVDPISDLDTPRKGFDDPRDPWDARYSNDNPRNYSDGSDQRAAHAAAREAFVNRASPATANRNYTSGGVRYGPVHHR